MLALLIGGIVMNLFFFYLVTWRHLLAGALLGLCGYTLGGGAATMAGMNRAEVRLGHWQDILYYIILR